MKIVGVAILLVALTGCGARSELKPAVGHALPVGPYGRVERPIATELLTPAPQARPGRAVELRQRSEPRVDDPFDLPPQE